MWHSYFTYDESTGLLRWKHRTPTEFKSKGAWKRWGTQFYGKIAGNKKSYPNGDPHAVEICLHQKTYQAHRVIWEMMVGPIGDGLDIDHKDGNAWNNRLDNLRPCTKSQNMMNRRKPSHNTSGYKGVSWHAKGEKWHAQIRVAGKNIHLGLFSDKELASEAYINAASIHHKQFARSN